MWRNSFAGTEIKTVRVVYDSDNTGGRKVKNYDYHIEAIKSKYEIFFIDLFVFSGMKLNMRGQASGGQRMLVSVLLRLAISETLCPNCGFIALDEPTIHLDVEHTRMLAELLANFV